MTWKKLFSLLLKKDLLIEKVDYGNPAADDILLLIIDRLRKFDNMFSHEAADTLEDMYPSLSLDSKIKDAVDMINAAYLFLMKEGSKTAAARLKDFDIPEIVANLYHMNLEREPKLEYLRTFIERPFK